jgi:hypothetical protein
MASNNPINPIFLKPSVVIAHPSCFELSLYLRREQAILGVCSPPRTAADKFILY